MTAQPDVDRRRSLPKRDPVERFWEKVDRSGDCWVWVAGRSTRRYGQFWSGGRRVPAHRFSYELHFGPITDPRLDVCHTCDNPPCVRPDHLWLGTPSENALDMVAKGRQNNAESAKTHCPKGHPFDAYRGRGRYCTVCNREMCREYRVRHGLYAPARVPTACAHCGATFNPDRKTMRFCSARCRWAYQSRERRAVQS
jgi:hypothetical protein